MRLDSYLVENNYFDSRSKAKDAIIEGNILIDNKVITKPSYELKDFFKVEVLKTNKYVSRAGFKLEQALNDFKIDLNNKVMIDIGSSTGGFTDCALQHGVKKVYDIDVGSNQLVDKIKNNPNVIVRENTNARYLTKDMFEDEIDFISMDVSFISCLKILPVISDLLKNKGEAVVLVKPQFEVGPQYLDKHGVVNNKKAISKVLLEIDSLLTSLKLVKLNLVKSQLIGRTGNEEYLLYIRKMEEE